MELTNATFDTIVSEGKPMVIDFWATWCVPCKKVAPIIDELAEKYQPRVVVGKVNVEDEDDLASRFGIRNVPTVLFIKNGAVVDKIVGATQKAAYEEKLKSLLDEAS